MFPTSAYICFAIFASLASAWLFFLSFSSSFGLFCLLWRLLGRFLGQNMPKCLDPGCPRMLLSYGFPRNSLVCLGSADVSKKCSQMSKMSPQSVQDDPQSSPKSAKEGPNEAQRHPMSATRVPKDAKRAPQKVTKESQKCPKVLSQSPGVAPGATRVPKRPPKAPFEGPKMDKNTCFESPHLVFPTSA